MRKVIPRLVMLLTGLLPGIAQSASEPVSQVDGTLIEFCRVIVAHVPSSDVHYRPGVDAQGRPVVPADVGGTQRITPPAVIDIELDIPLRELIGDASPTLVGAAEANLGRITVNRSNGEVLYNGQLLAGGVANEIKQSCLRLHLK